MYYLGTVTGASGAYSNTVTGVSGIGTFNIPYTTKSLYLMPSASGVFFEFVASGSQTTAARAAQLDGPNIINGPFRVVVTNGAATAPIVSVYNSAGGFVSVRVYSGPTS